MRLQMAMGSVSKLMATLAAVDKKFSHANKAVVANMK